MAGAVRVAASGEHARRCAAPPSVPWSAPWRTSGPRDPPQPAFSEGQRDRLVEPRDRALGHEPLGLLGPSRSRTTSAGCGRWSTRDRRKRLAGLVLDRQDGAGEAGAELGVALIALDDRRSRRAPRSSSRRPAPASTAALPARSRSRVCGPCEPLDRAEEHQAVGDPVPRLGRPEVHQVLLLELGGPRRSRRRGSGRRRGLAARAMPGRSPSCSKHRERLLGSLARMSGMSRSTTPTKPRS